MGITCGSCYSNYDIFEGFGRDQSNLESVDTTDVPLTNQNTTIAETISTLQDNSTNMTISSTNATPRNKIKPSKSTCPEEPPTNIGSYEVPSPKDVVLFTKDLLLSMFETYERDAMALLVDIKEVTKAATILGNECPYNKEAYKRCVKRVSVQSGGVTKSLVNSLQMEKVDVKALMDNTICTLSEMKSDPMFLIKLLAQETVMLKFALPGFLRLLDSCSELCFKSQVVANSKKPLRRMTDQDLVVKHFLTNKNYSELIKDSRRSV